MEIGIAFLTALLSITFLVSGVAKMIDRKGFDQLLVGLGIRSNVVRTSVLILLPLSEICAGSMLLTGIPPVVRFGAELVMVLLLLFIGVAIVAMKKGRAGLRCSCFGPFTESSFGRNLLYRNIVLALLAFIVVVGQGIDAIEARPVVWEPVEFLAIAFPALATFLMYLIISALLGLESGIGGGAAE